MPLKDKTKMSPASIYNSTRAWSMHDNDGMDLQTMPHRQGPCANVGNSFYWICALYGRMIPFIIPAIQIFRPTGREKTTETTLYLGQKHISIRIMGLRFMYWGWWICLLVKENVPFCYCFSLTALLFFSCRVWLSVLGLGHGDILPASLWRVHGNV